MKSQIKKLSLTNYVVDDLNLDSAEVILILESPHTKEVEKKCPLSGSSGKSIYKLVVDEKEDKAFGIYIKEKKIQDIGIVNICNIPLQLKAYDCNRLSCEQLSFICKLDTLRRKYKNKNKSDILSKKYELVYKDFYDRLSKIDTNNITFIVCGRIAQHFFDKAKEELKLEFDNEINVQHPSYGQWKKNKDNNQVKKSINELKKYLSNN